MLFENTFIKDVKVVTPSIFKDERGYFFESYNKNSFNNQFKKIIFVQDNESESKKGTLRGLHFQSAPFEQSKLVRVVKGMIQDVVVDLRLDSPTYRKYFSIILDDLNKKQLFVPKGFAHGFLTLSSHTIVSYKVDYFYRKDYDNGIKYDDPILNINWELEKNKISVSDKDNSLPYL